MRILHVISSLNPAAGGPPVVAINLAKAQTKLGHSVQIAAEDIPQTIDVPTRHWPRSGLGALFGSAPREMNDDIAAADVCHFHGIWEPLFILAGRTARQLGRPYLVTPHGMLDPWSLRQKRLKKKIAWAMGFRSMVTQAALIHALNDDEKRLLQPLGLQAPCAIIPNGMFLEELDPPADSNIFRQQFPQLGTRCYVLFLSRLHYKKGLDLLVNAFAQVAATNSDVDLVIAGPDDGESESIRSRAEGLGLSMRILLTGPLYGAAKWSALAGAACFCLPSRQEGFSVAILEAMASRIPVVISDQCHFPEVAEVNAGTIVPLTESAVVSALNNVLAHPQIGKTMGENGRRLVEQQFTWDRVAELTLQHYGRLIAQSPNSSKTSNA